MRQVYKNSAVLLIFFLILLFKDSIYKLFINTSEPRNIAAEIEILRNDYYYNEYLKLLSEMDIVVEDNYSYMFSKIIYRDIYDYYNELTILKGSEDNLQEGKAVINNFGLVGIIKKVNKNSSIVNLITNNDSTVSVKVNDAYGILKSQNNKLVLKSVNNYENINIGDVVYTSGIGNLPGNIKVGEIISIKEDNLGIERKISIEPSVDFDNINYVAILNGGEL